MRDRQPPRDSAGDAARLFDGQRLTLARQLAGMRKNTLAELIGKTPTAVAGYEIGTKRPAPATVAQLCLALRVPPEFFLAGHPPYSASSGAPHFRSLRSTSQIVRDQAYAYGRVAVSVGAALERHVELPPVDVPRIPVSPGSEGLTQAPDAARAVRGTWGVGSGRVGHLIRLAENHGVLVVFGAPQTTSVDAYSFDSSHRPVILLNPAKDDYYRQRFDLSHEIGHLVMHADSDPGGRDVEEQANRFAAEFLLPADAMSDLLPARADFPRLLRLKEDWGVSMQALLYRARQLGVMNETTYRNAMATLSARGWRRREPGMRPAIEQPSLLPRAVELLTQELYDSTDLARAASVPPGLYSRIVARTPESRGPDPDERPGNRITPILETPSRAANHSGQAL